MRPRAFIGTKKLKPGMRFKGIRRVEKRGQGGGEPGMSGKMMAEARSVREPNGNQMQKKIKQTNNKLMRN